MVGENQMKLERLKTAKGDIYYYPLSHFRQAGFKVDELPFSKKLLLESLIRNKEKYFLSEEEIIEVIFQSRDTGEQEMPFMPTRVIMQDASGLPALVDLASLREQLAKEGFNPEQVNPLIPVDLIIDHSLQVDQFGTPTAASFNLQQEYKRNGERYAFFKWAQHAFKNVRVIPPAKGIIHQINLEHLSPVIQMDKVEGKTIIFPDAVIGTDSHTTMINALGVLGWGVGGMEAEAVMMGIPISMVAPQVVGVKLTGSLQEGVTATDVALTLTQYLRELNVVGMFVEFYGPGLAELSLPDRATIANMAPEYGATMGFFPVDRETLRYLKLTGRSDVQVHLIEQYCNAQGLFYRLGMPTPRYDRSVEFSLSQVVASVAGPQRPHDRVSLEKIKQSFYLGLKNPENKPNKESLLKHGSIVIASITSCTNTSNPVNMIGAGLLAKKAVQYGLTVPRYVTTSLAPGSKVVSHYLEKAGLIPYLEQLGFYHVGYGCAVCVGNSGSLPEYIEREIKERDLTVVSVLSGNRNFEGRIHPLVKANYLASPPLVVAFAIAGKVDINFTTEPLGYTAQGEAVYLKDIWPHRAEIEEIMETYISGEVYQEVYNELVNGDDNWDQLPMVESALYQWDPKSTYIKPSPFFKPSTGFVQQKGMIKNARALLVLGDMVTTDHISPVGPIQKESVAGHYLSDLGVNPEDYNTYGARRGNHEVLMRGTFANPRLHNHLVDRQGGYTKHVPSGKFLSIYEAAQRYKGENCPLIILAGKQYGAGSARDWAAKGTYLLGVKAVIAESFERIHRTNLAMIGILPLQFKEGDSWQRLGLTGGEVYTIFGLDDPLYPHKTLKVVADNGAEQINFQVILRLDTQFEIENYLSGGIFQKVLQEWKT